MPQPLFDAQLTSADGKTHLFIRGPFEVEDGMSFEMRIVPVVPMDEWPRIWKSEEVEDESIG